MSPEPPRIPRAAFIGLLLLSAATLLLEVALTRVLSVSLWYHFAYMVVSTALFGFGFAGVALSLRKNPAAVSARLVAIGALGTPLAFSLGFWLFNQVPFEPFSLGAQAIQWLYLPLAYLAVTLPFFFAGLAISALLTRHAAAVHRLYLFDLLGGGAGSLLVVLLLPLCGGAGTLLCAAVLAAAGAALLCWEAGRRWTLGAVATGVLLAALLPFSEAVLPLRISADKVTGGGVPVEQVLRDPGRNLFTAWNTLSRIDVIENRGRRLILIDAGTAMTRLAQPEGVIDGLPPTADEEGFFVRLFSSPHVLVVGSGGGREVLLALRNGAGRVTAVEINPAINEVVQERMAEFTGHLYEDPRVAAVTDEARSFLRRSTDRYQVIHCPHTISNAAMASGSLSLAENHLMTLEAFQDYLGHLAEDGVLVITRPEAHLPRLLTTLRAAFGSASLAERVLIWKQPSAGLSFYAGVAFRTRPFTPEDRQAFAETLARQKLLPLFLAGDGGVDPYPALLTAADPGSVPIPFAAILTPATDDRPFFNQRVPLSEISWADLLGVFSRGQDARMALEDRPVAEAALIVLLLQSVALALVFIVLPLLVFRRRALEGRGRLRTLLCFASLGVAYIVVEMGFIQRFGLFLGKPVVIFSTVLGCLLVSSGLGSAYSRRFSGAAAPWRACLGAALAAAAGGLISWLLVDLALAWPTGLRVGVAALVLVPVGFVMGMPFPLLVRRLEATQPERIPWAWGVNGFASVVGSIGAVVLGMTAGYTVVLLAGTCAYALAALVATQGSALASTGKID